jgi:hypothetical protein
MSPRDNVVEGKVAALNIRETRPKARLESVAIQWLLNEAESVPLALRK